MNVVRKIIPIFARKMKEVMGDNRYPIIEEETGIDMCCEPVVGYAATGSGYASTLVDEDVSQMLVDKIGFYTDDPDVFDARIAEIEADVERAERGDESDWLTAEEFDAELKQEFPWLR